MAKRPAVVCPYCDEDQNVEVMDTGEAYCNTCGRVFKPARPGAR